MSLLHQKSVKSGGGSFHRGVAFAVLLAFWLGVLQMQVSAEEGYHTPLGAVRSINNDPDAKVGSPAPGWLAKIAPAGSCVVAISCTSCSLHNVLPPLWEIARKRPLVVLATSASSSELRNLRDEFPEMRFVPVGERVAGLNLSITPKLYRLDAKGRFSYVQDAFMNNDDFLAQF